MTRAAPSCTITAAGPGVYANTYSVVVATVSGGYTITISNSGTVLEVSNTLVTVADAVAYGQTSQYVVVTATGANPPAAATTAMSGGADDLTDITSTQYANAFALFIRDYGPGHVSAPGQTTSTIQEAAVTHCNTAGPAGFRVAILDMPDENMIINPTLSSSSASSAIVSAAATITALSAQARCVGMFAPWADIAPVPGTTGTRAVPPSAFYAGLAQQSDINSVTSTSPYGNPNLPIAGKNGILQTAVDLHATFADTDRQTLNTAGVNIIKRSSGGFRIYGNVTGVNRITDPLYFMLSNARLDMAILAQADVIQQDHDFDQIDGNGVEAASYGGDLTNMMSEFQSAGALFPNAAGVFFTVDTSSDVNTPTNEAQGILSATIAYARAPGAEQVNLNIYRASAATGV